MNKIRPNLAAIEDASPEEKHALMGLALGRMFRIGAGKLEASAEDINDLVDIIKACGGSK